MADHVLRRLPRTSVVDSIRFVLHLRIRGNVSGRRLWALVAVGVAVAAFGAFLVLGSIDDDPGATRVSVMDLPAVTPTATATVTAVATATPRPHAALLDGVHMSDAEWELRRNRRPLAIVIDNVAGGVPQAGLDQADLVYESIVEGGSTRFLAVFWRRDAEAVFPVRSARTPFVILASELDALLGHGGSAQTDNEANASGQILEWNGSDLDAFQPPAVAAYRRLGDRFAPYNLAVSTLLLRQVASEAGFERPATASPWEFADDRTRSSVGISAGGVEVSFRNQRTAGELIQFRWDPLANDYIRYQWGGVHPILPELKPLRFKNVVVMRVPLQVVDDSGHVVLEQIGNGAAQIFLDGVVIEATWRKPNRTARTRFYDQAGEEIPFNRAPS